MKKNHYSTSQHKTLCEQKFKNTIKSSSRFSFKLGETNNCKKCESILNEHISQTNSKCVSYEKLGYNTDCQWRDITKCNCIDDCTFKEK